MRSVAWKPFATVAGLALACCMTPTAHAQLPPAAPVTAAPVVEQQNVVAGRTFVGTVQPARRSVVGSAVDGRVVEYPIEAGDAVKQGQPLAQLLTDSLEIQIAAARAELDLHRSEYEEMKNGSRDEEIRDAEARMLSAQAAAEYAESKLKRTRQLIERGASSQDELQDHTSAALAARHMFEAAQANYDMVKSGPRKERIDQALARVKMSEETLNQLLDRLKKHTMIAPFDGYVTQEFTEIGQWISTGQTVAEVVETKEVDVVVEVPEMYIPNLEIGSPARVEVGALPHELFEGRITQIVPQADLRSRNFPVKVRLSNQKMADGQMLIKPGMIARASLPVEHKSNAQMVPKDALVMGGPAPMVYVIDVSASDSKQGTVRPVIVSLGVASGGTVEVAGELRKDQLVVVEGNERLRPGQGVMIKEVRQPLPDTLPKGAKKPKPAQTSSAEETPAAARAPRGP